MEGTGLNRFGYGISTRNSPVVDVSNSWIRLKNVYIIVQVRTYT